MADEISYLDCPVCGQLRPAAALDCAADHGPDCPERVCLDCGAALFLDPVLIIRRRRGTAVSHAA
jgi:hypothetical protein